jgi:hypothetical protein
MKVLSINAGFMNGPNAIMQILDQQLAKKLGGDVIIHKITDALYCEGPFKDSPLMVRVVIYDEK